ncbi:putative lipase Atg15p [[Candida] railenensis]|uniref:Putative lipase ATG15 n=1 Tax=[Candida] railenensis TaxID=45579 RepID=A0A9P0QMY3_9ASCO|nr:putative lipase Atg15p [[Candida] railenensis]
MDKKSLPHPTSKEGVRKSKRVALKFTSGFILTVFVIALSYNKYLSIQRDDQFEQQSVDTIQQAQEQFLHEQAHSNSGGDADGDTFQLKHIYHHGTGEEHHKVHRRLDITNEYLHKNDLINFSVEDADNEASFNSENLEEVYRQMDWPKIHKGKNPWTIELPIKTDKKQKGKVRRLTERHTPNFIESYLDYAIEVKGNPSILNMMQLQWDDEEDISIPNVKDKDTIVSLATISSNAYVRIPKNEDEKNKSDWIDVGEPWGLADNTSADPAFGWESDGLRGHIFVSKDNKTVVIGIKGTSGAGLPGSGSEETQVKDKTNDNLLFSCCCARVGYMWTTVCDCYEKTYTCNQDCLEKELIRKDRYYQAVIDLYRNVSSIYPPETTNIWLTGHSLGGALASLLGRTFGLPAVAFEAPGEMLATKRLHLPQPPGLPKYLENIWHFGHTADPIFMGVCNGASSTCNVAGYAMETSCHTGKQCVYDVVTDKGWSVSVLNHRIHTVIDDVILAYNETAPCFDQPPCRDCFNWKFVSHDDEKKKKKVSSTTSLKPTSTSTSSKTSTSTSITSTDTSKPTDSPQKCLKRTWYGWCVEWGSDNDTTVISTYSKFTKIENI